MARRGLPQKAPLAPREAQRIHTLGLVSFCGAHRQRFSEDAMRHFHIGALLLFVLMTTLGQAQTSRASSAASYLDRGNNWYTKGELDKAIADYDLAITFAPHSDGVYFQRGLARLAKGDLDIALSDFNRAIELNPRLAEAYVNR